MSERIEEVPDHVMVMDHPATLVPAGGLRLGKFDKIRFLRGRGAVRNGNRMD